MKLRHLGGEEVDGYINEKIDDEELSDKTVNNHVTLLATMLRTATTFKVPWVWGVPKFRKPKVAQWLRADDEVRRFLAAACEEGEPVLVFYTTARRREDEVDAVRIAALVAGTRQVNREPRTQALLAPQTSPECSAMDALDSARFT